MSQQASAKELIGRRRSLLSGILKSANFTSQDIHTLTLAAGGNSRETWVVELGSNGDSRRLVFRCDPDDWIRPDEMRNEILGLRLANSVGVPAPELLLSNLDVEAERPFVLTEYVDGETIPRRIMRDDAFGVARSRFSRQVAEVLAKLHTSASCAAEWQCRDPIADLVAHRDRVKYPSPALEGALYWLAKNRPDCPEQLSPVHGDFRLGNLMVDSNGLVAVLDWETCHLCDPDEDIGWLCSPAWRYGSALPVGGLGSLEEFYSVYEEHADRTVDRENVRWWTIFGLVRWGYACATPTSSTRKGDRMEQAAVARQISRQEYFVLRQFEGIVEGA